MSSVERLRNNVSGLIGFLMTLLQLDTGNADLTVPDIKLQMFPKEAFTAGK